MALFSETANAEVSGSQGNTTIRQATEAQPLENM